MTTLLRVKSDGHLKEAGMESKIADILPKKKFNWVESRKTN